MTVNAEYLERYARHIMLKEIGGPGQKRLSDATVLIVGMGGLGCPASLYLAAAGAGRLVIMDDDVVSRSNLQRQVLFGEADVGRAKVEAASEKLRAINPALQVDALPRRIGADDVPDLPPGALVLDGCDNFATRFAVNDICHARGLKLVSGAVGAWMGQVSVYASGVTKDLPVERRLPCYRCLTPDIPETEENCAEIGVIGPLTGIVGARMALEAVKEITGAGDTMAGRLWLFDGLTGETRTVGLPRDPACPVCGQAPR